MRNVHPGKFIIFKKDFSARAEFVGRLMFARKGTQRPATSGGGMPAQLKRAALSVLGITVGRAGARRRHPEEQPPRRAHRLGAVFPGGARRASVSYAREGATPAPQNENQEILPGVRNIAVPPKDADVTAQGLLGHTRYDRPQMTIHPSHPISPNLTVAMPDSDSPILILVYAYSAVSSASARGRIACVTRRACPCPVCV